MSKKTFCSVFFVMCVKKITNQRGGGTPSKVHLKFEHSLGPIERFPYFIVNRRSFCGSWLTMLVTNLRDMILTDHSRFVFACVVSLHSHSFL